jgi:hypothetical protein
VEFRGSVKIPMRDGVRLNADISLPRAGGRFPAVVTRTPYDIGGAVETGERYAQAGYAFVAVDCRGRFDSDGDWRPFEDEARDGYDTVEWVASQPWSNGKVGMVGGSYGGYTQWQAASIRPPHLASMAPVVMSPDLCDGVMYQGGAFVLSIALGWGSGMEGRSGQRAPVRWPDYFRTLPLGEADVLGAGRRLPTWREWLSHGPGDDYWRPLTATTAFADWPVPILCMGGWYDCYASGVVRAFGRLVREARSKEVRRDSRLIMGPWPHGIGGQKCGEVDFGPQAAFDREALTLRWLGHWLKGEEKGLLRELPAVRLFVTGENAWRGFGEWPPSEARQVRLYLGSGGRANSLFGDGTLSRRRPGLRPPKGFGPQAGEERADGFDYNPENPVPTLGGQVIGIPDCPPGPVDQRPLERRDDVLVYRSEPVAEPLTVVGHVRAVLHASSSAADTDFAARLVDVWPDGRALILTEGIVRARYRRGFEREEMLEPGKVYAFTVEVGALAHTFLPGHRVQLDVSSSNFPRFDRNLNTGEPLATGARTEIAHQSVHHDRKHPSHLVLPVVPSAPLRGKARSGGERRGGA